MLYRNAEYCEGQENGEKLFRFSLFFLPFFCLCESPQTGGGDGAFAVAAFFAALKGLFSRNSPFSKGANVCFAFLEREKKKGANLQMNDHEKENEH